MTENIPKDWHRVTPALAGRLQARGIPPPVFYAAGAFAIMFGLAYRASFASYLGDSWGLLAAFVVGGLIAIAIIMAVRPLSKRDRDWFAIMMDWWAIKIEILKIRMWERFYKW